MNRNEKYVIILVPSQMRLLARYEIDFKDVLTNFSSDEVEIVCPKMYYFTLEDLAVTLENLKKKNPTVSYFCEYWLYWIEELWDFFGIDYACDVTKEESYTLNLVNEYDNLKLTKSNYFKSIIYKLEDIWSFDCEDDNDKRISEVLDIDSALEEINRFERNYGKPILEWEFTTAEMENYIQDYDNDLTVKFASENQLALCRRFVDELCKEDNSLALNIKGYSCYGGNRLYECDWECSRQCMQKLFEKTDNPQYANTLGYIYYYGRCNNGAAEYEKAFHYFEISAANGLYEGMYKLADMYLKGNGCIKSPKTAKNLYKMVYNNAIKNFLNGEDANFADAALRMGNVYAMGIDTEVDIKTAYFYYLEACYAAKLRADNSDSYGNTTVVINAQNALDNIKNQLGNNFFKGYIDFDTPYIFSKFACNNNLCLLSKKQLSESTAELKVRRLDTLSCPEPEMVLINIPELELCERTLQLTINALDLTDIWFQNNSTAVKFDFCYWNDSENRFEFLSDYVMVAWVKADKYRLSKDDSPLQADNTKYRFVSVEFSPGGRRYDYICDIAGVRVGDTVIVNGYEGESEVVVKSIFEKRISELTLPFKRYKKILRKK